MSQKNPNKELRYYGVNACRALWDLRREEVIRVYLIESRKREFGGMLRWCAETKRAYRFVSPEEMEKITASTHHEGICVQAVKRDAMDFDTFGKAEFDQLEEPIVFLDGVENPHNLGSILRVSAHFDVGMVLGQKGRIPTLSAASCRVSEGGAEYVNVAETKDPTKALKTLKRRGYHIVSTGAKGGHSLFRYKFLPKTALIFGAERGGVSSIVAGCADETICIPGSGAIESLNVASACAIVLAEHNRQLWKK